ncbi:MAG: type II toxin-antitoxin system RelE/ParE family toxin, partial [Lachnospiraceae bacterium]|nr:type II toxin-antitoxin system RelE/ParE family toxin [Lachnospiraceae bacterium]
VLLHVFMKRTQKTPQKEIERAKRNLDDYQGRKHHEDK